MDKKHKPK